MRDKNRKKLYLVGIDSAPLWIIEKLSKRPGMKGFRLFMNRGILTSIESTVPPVTSTAWPTIYTGLDQGQHGIMDFSTLDKNYERELLYYDAVEHPPFWDILARQGFNSLVITPAVALQKSRYKNVDMLTGWPLQARFSSAKMEEISKRFGYDGEPDIGNALNTGKISVEEASRVWTNSIKRRAELSKYLIEKNNYDLSFVCFTETDRIQHYSLNLKGWEQYVAPLYEEISSFIDYLDERITKLHEDAIIMIVSDHGAQQIHHKFLSNSWIVQNNYGALKEEVYKRNVSKSKGTMSKVKSRIVDKLVESKFRRVVYDKMPKSLKRASEKFVDESFDYESEGKYIRIKESDFDMRTTKAFCSISAGPMGMVFLNDSRFAHPLVRQNEKAALKKEIMAKITKIKDANGKNLIKNVYDGKKYFPATGKAIFPDVIFELEDGYTADFSGYSEKGLYFEPEINRRGEHTRMGIFGIKSYDSKINLSGIKKKGLNLTEVSPTILKYFGINPKIGKSLI